MSLRGMQCRKWQFRVSVTGKMSEVPGSPPCAAAVTTRRRHLESKNLVRPHIINSFVAIIIMACKQLNYTPSLAHEILSSRERKKVLPPYNPDIGTMPSLLALISKSRIKYLSLYVGLLFYTCQARGTFCGAVLKLLCRIPCPSRTFSHARLEGVLAQQRG